ncbi:MAG: excalibur calcium-binding domain-containing protein, partial [Thermomonas sp.]
GWALLAVVVAVGWYAYTRFGGIDAHQAWAQIKQFNSSSVLEPATLPSAQFHCDGRTQCPQLNSCAEAKYFMTNCPNTELDDNGNGVPCEEKLCR